MSQETQSKLIPLAMIVLAVGGCSRRSTGQSLHERPPAVADIGQASDGIGADQQQKKTPIARSASEALSFDDPPAADFPHLHNLLQITEQMYSGGEPQDERAFAELARLGVKVIVSVDGARPNLELAGKYGMQYVHIPIGYDGFGAEAGKSFARVADEVDETIYVHCHHGQHRGPAGAAAICVAKGEIDGQQALQILERAGTSKGYAGLWSDVQRYERPPAGEELPELVPAAEVDSLAAAMAQIDRASDNLKLCAAADWSHSTDHPDIAAEQQALLLREGFRETVRQLDEVNEYDERLLSWMREAEKTAATLEANLNAGELAAVTSTFAKVQDQCKRCHHDYRN